ncbi:MAG: hypothetical protein R2932_53045 [Caldilineaceae bacterium]
MEAMAGSWDGLVHTFRSGHRAVPGQRQRGAGQQRLKVAVMGVRPHGLNDRRNSWPRMIGCSGTTLPMRPSM